MPEGPSPQVGGHSWGELVHVCAVHRVYCVAPPCVMRSTWWRSLLPLGLPSWSYRIQRTCAPSMHCLPRRSPLPTGPSARTTCSRWRWPRRWREAGALKGVGQGGGRRLAVVMLLPIPSPLPSPTHRSRSHPHHFCLPACLQVDRQPAGWERHGFHARAGSGSGSGGAGTWPARRRPRAVSAGVGCAGVLHAVTLNRVPLMPVPLPLPHEVISRMCRCSTLVRPPLALHSLATPFDHPLL